MQKKHEKCEFWHCHSNHVSVVTVAGNCPLAIAQIGRKHEKASFGDAPQTLYRCSRLQEIVPGTEKMCVIAHENGGTKHKKHEFS
jgi:hypothetical protein